MLWSVGRFKLHEVEFWKSVKIACSPRLARLAAIAKRIPPKQAQSSISWSPYRFTICWFLERGAAASWGVFFLWGEKDPAPRRGREALRLGAFQEAGGLRA